MQLGTLYVALFLLAAVVTTGVGAFAWRHRDVPGARWFIGLQFLDAGWALTNAVALTVPASAGTTRLTWELLTLSLSVFIPVLWVAFAFEYVGDGVRITRQTLAGLLVVPAATLLAFATPARHDLVWTDWTVVEVAGVSVVSFDYGPWLLVQLVYTFSLFTVGTAVVLRGAWSFETANRDRALAVFVGTLAPVVTSVAVASGALPVEGLDPTPVTLTVTGIAFSYALFRTQLLQLVPATRRLGEETAIADLDDGVVIVTAAGDVLTMNPAARDILGYAAGEAVGEDVDSVLAAVGLDRADAPTQFQTADGRTFELVTSSVTGRRNNRIGETLLLSDVTDRERREQRLTVLNRVLRHNLRNDLGVVRGYATLLGDRLDGADGDIASYVAETSNDLVELGEKAREIERIVDRGRDHVTDVDVTRVVDEVGDRTEHIEQSAEAEVVVTTPDECTIGTDDFVLASVLENVVENALRHGTDEGKRVWVSVDELPTGGVEITVVDEGPGIPPAEVDVLESGSETPLEHGDSLGLWLVYWGTTQLGGTVEFTENDPRGTVVTLSIPSLDE
ncbi:histidine kinase N-terminal 7TM domain-containing protein [Haloarchaeobius sp. DT45]|uniref:histidine kinase N-terminal 7TM domain-containing protein n=1 Tax=Haloarchaeobius sp. DT45 TaxID=3446116 RepID=UPI003F6B4B87